MDVPGVREHVTYHYLQSTMVARALTNDCDGNGSTIMRIILVKAREAPACAEPQPQRDTEMRLNAALPTVGHNLISCSFPSTASSRTNSGTADPGKFCDQAA